MISDYSRKYDMLLDQRSPYIEIHGLDVWQVKGIEKTYSDLGCLCADIFVCKVFVLKIT